MFILIFNRTVTIVFCIFVVLPLLLLTYAAFLPPDAFSVTTLGFSLKNFAAAIKTDIWRSLGISLLASGLVVVGQLIIGLMAAYAIRMGLKILGLVLIALALPSELLMVPLYGELQFLKLLNTLGALIVPFLASPLVIFLLLQGFRRLPLDAIEAARLDGASELGIVWRIIAPLLRPELLAAGMLGFTTHWNLVLFPKVMTGLAQDTQIVTVQVFLSNLLQNDRFNFGVLAATSLIATLPLIIIYLIFEKRIITVFEGSFKQ